MASGFGESASHSPRNPSCSSNNSNGDAGNFECNICFDLAQDPIVTLCGHLFCWPCLYKWLHIHSRSRECPVCKALVEEEKLVPLYGRGKSSTDPRSKSIPGVNIPNRPAGQRPETAPPPNPNQFPQNGFGFMGGLGGFGGFAPMSTASCWVSIWVSTFISWWPCSWISPSSPPPSSSYHTRPAGSLSEDAVFVYHCLCYLCNDLSVDQICYQSLNC